MTAPLDSFREWVAALAGRGWLPSVFTYAFLVNAVLCAFLIGPVLGGLGTIVVTRRLAFFSQAIGHAAMTGVAIGILLGEPREAPYVSLFSFCVLFALLLNYTRRHTRMAADTVIAVFLCVSLAVGACLVLAVSARTDAHLLDAVLFGSVLTVNDTDILVLTMIAASCAAVGLPLFNGLLIASCSPEIARVRGLPVRALDYAFILLITLITVAAVKIIGAVLVEALLVIPAATARNLARSVRGFVGWSVGVATFSCVAGIIVPMQLRWPLPSGGAIILVAALCFGLSLFRPRGAAPAPA
jgi:zinc transport system permease protein